MVHNVLPKQTDLNTTIKLMERKILKGNQLPVTIKEKQEGYLASPYFKNIYLYPAQNKLPSSKAAIKQVGIQAERNLLLDT